MRLRRRATQGAPDSQRVPILRSPVAAAGGLPYFVVVVPAAPPAAPAPVVPEVVEPLDVPAAPLLLVGAVEDEVAGAAVPAAVPAAEPMPDADPVAEPVPAQAVRASTQATGKRILITFQLPSRKQWLKVRELVPSLIRQLVSPTAL